MIYRINAYWSCCSSAEIEADSLEEAIEKAEEGEGDFEISENYIDDSFEINYEFTREINKDKVQETKRPHRFI